MMQHLSMNRAVGAGLAATAIVIAFAPGHAARASADACGAQRAAYDQVRLRAQASLTSLQLLRDYRRELDELYLATRRSQYQDAVVDVASLAAGWPLGSAAEKYFIGKAENTMSERLIKAGFKSVDKALLKDPRLNMIFDQFTTTPEKLSGVQYDVFKQEFKNSATELWGKDAADSVVGFWDVTVFGLKQYQGMKQLDAIRALGRSVDAQIVSLQTRHAEQFDVLENANHAVALCDDRVAKGLPPDNNNYFWRSVVAYLGLKPAPTAARPVSQQQASAWSGTYEGANATLTLSGSGTSLTGTMHYEATGSTSDEKLACIASGSTAQCNSNGIYDDADKTITFTSRWSLTLSGATLSRGETITSAVNSWKNGDKGYVPAVHPGAQFPFTFTRQ